MSLEKKIITIAILTLLLIAIISGGTVYYAKKNDYRSMIKNDKITATNPDFALGEKLLSERKTNEAIVILEKALKEAKNFEEEAYIKHALALTYASTNKTLDDYKKSIPLYKEIVAHPDYPLVMKALSIDGMDRLLLSSVSTEVAKLIIDDEPYKSFGNNEDLDSLRKNLLDYGKSIYPLAGIEVKRTALGAENLYKSSQKGLASDEEKETVKKMFSEAVQRWKRQVTDAPHFKVYTPENFLFRAIAAQYYMWATQTTDIGHPKDFYEQALELSDKEFNSIRPLIEYHYAAYLAKQDSDGNLSKIKELLKRYGTATENAYMAGVFKKEKGDILGEKENLIRLASLDSQFKNYLQKLGWQELDFIPGILPPKQ